jgi:4-hydroxybenzoate polyprenyltransferase
VAKQDGSRRQAWWQLIRPPNLFTVPGDPLAGFVLAGVLAEQPPAWHLAWWPMLAALLLYAGGLIGNDLADEEEDRRDRPSRPIPSGRISRRAARLAALGCGAAGLLCAAAAGWQTLLAALFTLAAILAYNGGLKRRLVAGSLTMGCCRGGSLLLGVMTAGWPDGAAGLVCAVVAGVTLYVAGVTAIADRETAAVRLGVRRWVPLAAVIGIGLALGWWLPLPGATLLLLAGAAAWAGYQAWQLRGIPAPARVGPAIGALIRGLLLVQAAVCALGGLSGAACAAALLVFWRLSAATARRFYAS